MLRIALAALCFLLCLTLGCTDEGVTYEDRMASAAAYDSLLRSLPDSVEIPESSIDSLFIVYEAAMRTGVDASGASAWADSVLGTMTLDEKIGQLFIVHLSESQYRGGLDGPDDAVRQHHIGGFLVPRLLPPREVHSEIQRLQRDSSVPLFFAADYERGVGRFNNALTELPSNMAIGATRDTLFAAAAGRLTAIEARALGVNLLFAPVVDVNNNPDNPIINIRSYGEDPELVGRMAASFVHEAESHGLMTTLKHFPGHGDTDVDTHARMATVEGDMEDLEQVELKPYRVVLNQSPQPTAVMSAHLWVEAIEESPLPATFSVATLNDLLRGDMGFEGIVVTDDIRMGALQTEYDVQERILRPLEAGADVILTPANVPEALRIVQEAVRTGRLSETDIDESVRRILSAKASAGLHRNRFSDRERLSRLLDEPRGSYIAQAIADRSITLLKTADALPLRPDSQDVSIVHLTNYQGSESIAAAMDLFDDALGQSGSRRFEEDPSAATIEQIVDESQESDVIVLALYLRLVAGRGEAGLFPRQTDLVHRLLETDTPVVLLTFGNPYAATAFRNADAIVVAYDQALPTITAATRVMKGEQRAPGRLPISVEPFEYGSGIDWVDGR